MTQHPEHETGGAPKGLWGRARAGLAGAASTAASAAYARARQAVPGTLTLTEPLRGTPLARRLATALRTTAHVRSAGSQVMSGSSLRSGMFSLRNVKEHARWRREGYRPADQGLDIGELVCVHGVSRPEIAETAPSFAGPRAPARTGRRARPWATPSASSSRSA